MSSRSISPTRLNPIGLFDSGLGGLTVYQELKRALPHESLVYLGDTARTPYGSKGRSTIIRYAQECTRFLLAQEVKLVVVACNTASSNALFELQESCPIPVIGTIDPVINELAADRPASVGILGTEATIASEAYASRIREKFPDISISQQACPLFVPLVEQGMLTGEITEKVVDLYLRPLRAAAIETLVLGCTHYPLLISAIKSYMGAQIKIIECSSAVAVEAKRLLTEISALAPERQASEHFDHFFVTDDSNRFNYLAGAFLQQEEVSSIKIDNLESFG